MRLYRHTLEIINLYAVIVGSIKNSVWNPVLYIVQRTESDVPAKRLLYIFFFILPLYCIFTSLK